MSKAAQALLASVRHLYESQLEAQGGGCAICGRPPSASRRLDIDHDHRTMVVRGLLCHRCNRNLRGWMDADWLRKAADYLDNPPWKGE